MTRHHSFLDKLLISTDRGLKTLVPGSSRARRFNPADKHQDTLIDDSPRHTAGLMRINHTGEVCAQALYHGQAITAKDPAVKSAMQHSADEEIDHLAWCEQRLRELGSHTSHLNPVFYSASFLLGALAGALGDRISLGFVAATEEQVCQHLREHLTQLPPEDEKSRAILEQMLRDESEHASIALAAGGKDFEPRIKELMTLASKVMTRSTYYI
ncbi:2-polyprenyl-3-methyl-6-methoxy-1,4-benzoquinone monooxygenase [Litorivivens sp.]|uniref:2-polyprenyl-3-methyl-6-methoxy-1,4-benzoquinone monooxygenase n=1 Tax=Litorivivens sp. TaxID=2020868 RepID=UPI0035631FEC